MTTTPDPIAAIERESENDIRRAAVNLVDTLVLERETNGQSKEFMDWAVFMTVRAFEEQCASLARQAAEKDAEIARLRRLATDRKYMLEAYRNMLGPKGLEVVTMWERQGVTRQHTTWGPEAHLMSGEGRAQVLLDVQTAVSVPMDFIDGGLPRVDVRSLTTEISDAQG